MKKTVLTFGLIAGAILSCFMALAIAFRNEIGFDRGEDSSDQTGLAAGRKGRQKAICEANWPI